MKTESNPRPVRALVNSILSLFGQDARSEKDRGYHSRKGHTCRRLADRLEESDRLLVQEELREDFFPLIHLEVVRTSRGCEAHLVVRTDFGSDLAEALVLSPRAYRLSSFSAKEPYTRVRFKNLTVSANGTVRLNPEKGVEFR